MRTSIVAAGILFAASFLSSAAEARQVYCYASVMPSGDKLSRALTPPKLYVTEIFKSDEDVFLMAVNFQETVPEAGLATCVTDEDEPNIRAAWDSFVGASKADGLTVVIKPAPTS